jgi:hypothetical protein
LATGGPTAVKRGDHKPPTCEHGEWRFAGADCKRQASKWRCPTGKCTRRGVVEREFGHLKNEWALAPLRVRRIERVRLHADLTIIAKLSRALGDHCTIRAAA